MRLMPSILASLEAPRFLNLLIKSRSLGILIGGMGAMVPERRAEIVALGLRSILSGTLATCMSGAVVGLLL